MSKRASATLIGAFVVGALVLIALAVILFGGKNVFRKKENVIMYFNESVYGLNVGAPVNVRGVQVGTVKNINIIFNTETGAFSVPVLIELNPGSIEQARQLETDEDEDPIRKLIEKLGFRGQLQLQSILTSQLYIQLDFHPGTELNYYGDGSVMEIPTIPSKIARLNRVLDKVHVDEVLEDLASTIQAVKEFVNSPGFVTSMDSLQSTLVSIEETSDSIESAFEDLQEKIGTFSNTSGTTLEDISRLTLEMQLSFQHINRLIGDGSPQLASLEAALEEITRAAAVISELDHAPERYSLEKTLGELERAARSVREMAETIENDPRSLMWGKQEGEQKNE